MSVERVSHLLVRRRTLSAIGFVVVAAAVSIPLLSVLNKASAQDTYAAYPVLSNAGPSGITTVSTAAQAQAAQGPIWGAGVGGVDIASAREAKVDVAGQRVWVAKAINGGICVLAMLEQPDRRGPASSCAPSSQLARGATIEGFGPGQETFLAGTVPSGVAVVSIQLTNGGSTTAPVTDNAYAIDAPSPIESVAFTDNGAQQLIKIGGA